MNRLRLFVVLWNLSMLAGAGFCLWQSTVDGWCVAAVVLCAFSGVTLETAESLQ